MVNQRVCIEPRMQAGKSEVPQSDENCEGGSMRQKREGQNIKESDGKYQALHYLGWRAYVIVPGRPSCFQKRFPNAAEHTGRLAFCDAYAYHSLRASVLRFLLCSCLLLTIP